MARQDLDLELKLRLRRVFWKMGFFCPLEVMVSAWEYETQKRHDVTDIDVLGIQFSADLRMTSVLADCKSGQETAGRLLWLRGAMDLLGASAGYFVKNRVHANNRAIAAKLHIATLDLDNLSYLEKQLHVSDVPGMVSDQGLYDIQQQLWGLSLARGARPTEDQSALKKVYQYFDYHFWFIEPYRNIITTIDHLGSIRHQLSGGDKKSELLFYSVATLFAVSILQAGREVLSKNLSEVASFARQYIFGGPLALRERERFFELLRKYTGEDVKLEPAYFTKLLELINTVIRHSNHSADSPRYIEAAMLHRLSDAPMDLKTFFGGGYNEGTVKVAKDILLFLIDTCGLHKGLIEEVLTQ